MTRRSDARFAFQLFGGPRDGLRIQCEFYPGDCQVIQVSPHGKGEFHAGSGAYVLRRSECIPERLGNGDYAYDWSTDIVAK